MPNVEGGRLTANEQFGIAKYTGELAAVRCEYDPSTNMISWPLLPNASNYKIYVASSDDNDYLFKTIVSFSGNGQQSCRSVPSSTKTTARSIT